MRELLLTTCDLQAVVGLPSGVFKPYSGVGTAALIFEAGQPTESVWFYDMTADGFTLDDKRTPMAANDIPDLLAKWPEREEGPNSYRVPIETIEGERAEPGGRPVQTGGGGGGPPRRPGRILREVIAIEREIIARGESLLAQLEAER